jgi:uncharacterized protein (DUF362 family)
MPQDPNRRKFLKTGLAAAAALASGSLTGAGLGQALADDAPDVVVAGGEESPGRLARASVEALGGMGRFVKSGAKVVIKPNMSFAREVGTGANTHPEMVAELAKMCVEAGASRVSVLDNVLHNPAECLKLSRIPEFCQGIANTTVNNVQAKRLFKEAAVPRGREFTKMEVIGEVLEADVLIAAPVGKSHSSAGVSLSMKGMMGLIYDRGSFHSRYNLHQGIVDMVTALRPHLVVIDGTKILSAGGPGGPGTVITLNKVIASTDMVAADAQMTVLGTWYERKFEPNQVKHIKLAAEQGLGVADLNRLKIKTIGA